jgi:gamma-glutamylcyclotransferase (GGCT)/AIG2-like uncharacterized protein YtfP
MSVARQRQVVRRYYYFAFGSNMNIQRMRDRGVPFLARCSGLLPGYRLTFDKVATAPQGAGYATIQPDPASAVEGVLYQVLWMSIRLLDRYEGVPIHYERVVRNVRHPNGSPVPALVYIAHPDRVQAGLRPPMAYLRHLLAGRDLLSPAYVEKLKAVTPWAAPVRGRLLPFTP